MGEVWAYWPKHLLRALERDIKQLNTAIIKRPDWDSVRFDTFTWHTRKCFRQYAVVLAFEGVPKPGYPTVIRISHGPDEFDQCYFTPCRDSLVNDFVAEWNEKYPDLYFESRCGRLLKQ